MKLLSIYLTISKKNFKRETCGMYQNYFYVNFFNLLENSSIVNEKSLNKRTIGKLSIEILSTDRQENEERIDQFTEENDLKRR